MNKEAAKLAFMQLHEKGINLDFTPFNGLDTQTQRGLLAQAKAAGFKARYTKHTAENYYNRLRMLKRSEGWEDSAFINFPILFDFSEFDGRRWVIKDKLPVYVGLDQDAQIGWGSVTRSETIARGEAKISLQTFRKWRHIIEGKPAGLGFEFFARTLYINSIHIN